MNDIYKYNATAVSVLAAYKSSGGTLVLNRKLALAVLRNLLSELTLEGDGIKSNTCHLTKALGTVLDTNTLSQWDCVCILKAHHKLIGLSN